MVGAFVTPHTLAVPIAGKPPPADGVTISPTFQYLSTATPIVTEPPAPYDAVIVRPINNVPI